MTSTVRIASKLPMALRIHEPNPNPEKPGLAPQLKSAVLNGSNHADAVGEGVTEVDADLWKAFSESEAYGAYGDSLRVLGKDEEPGGMGQFGFEPALEAAVKDRDNKRAAKQGSTVTDPPAIPAEALKSGSNDAVAVPVAAPGSVAADSTASSRAKAGK